MCVVECMGPYISTMHLAILMIACSYLFVLTYFSATFASFVFCCSKLEHTYSY